MSLQDLRNELRSSALPEGALALQKEFVESFLVKACDVMHSEQRSPDDWEAEHFLAAVGAISGHLFSLALTYADAGMTPHDERISRAHSASESISLEQLKSAIDHVRKSTVPGG
jgi:hypothetical protein